MADIDKSKDKPTTLYDIKESLEEYSLRKFISLASVLIDFLNDLVKDNKDLKEAQEERKEDIIKISDRGAELTNEKKILTEELSKYTDEIMKLNTQISEHQATCMGLVYENDELNKTVNEISKKDLKGKGEGSKIQFQLEEDLTKAKIDLSILMNRNSIYENELTKVKTDLDKSRKWIGSLQALTDPDS